MTFQQAINGLLPKANPQERIVLQSMNDTIQPFSDEVEILNNIRAAIEERKAIQELQSEVLFHIQRIINHLISVQFYPQDSSLTPNYEGLNDIDSFLQNIDLVRQQLKLIDPNNNQITRVINKVETLSDYQINGVPFINRCAYTISDFQIPNEQSEVTTLQISAPKTTNSTVESARSDFESRLKSQVSSLYLRLGLAALPLVVVVGSKFGSEPMTQPSDSQVSAPQLDRTLESHPTPISTPTPADLTQVMLTANSEVPTQNQMQEVFNALNKNIVIADQSKTSFSREHSGLPSQLLMDANQSRLSLESDLQLFSDLSNLGPIDTTVNMPQLIVIANDYAFEVLGLDPKNEIIYKITLQNILQDDPSTLTISALHPGDEKNNSSNVSVLELKISGFIQNNQFHPTTLHTNNSL